MEGGSKVGGGTRLLLGRIAVVAWSSSCELMGVGFVIVTLGEGRLVGDGRDGNVGNSGSDEPVTPGPDGPEATGPDGPEAIGPDGPEASGPDGPVVAFFASDFLERASEIGGDGAGAGKRVSGGPFPSVSYLSSLSYWVPVSSSSSSVP